MHCSFGLLHTPGFANGTYENSMDKILIKRHKFGEVLREQSNFIFKTKITLDCPMLASSITKTAEWNIISVLELRKSINVAKYSMFSDCVTFIVFLSNIEHIRPHF